MRLILALAMASLAAGTAEAEAPSMAQVCFVRNEDNGRMNLLAARIYGSHGSREELLPTLVGGAKQCVTIQPGLWSFEARSSHPYTAGAGDPNACKSAPLSVEAATTTAIMVAPKSKGSAYLCGWHLRLKATPPPSPSLCSPSAAADRCSGAEAGVVHLKAWATVAEWYECFSRCDDGCVAENLDRRLTRMRSPNFLFLGRATPTTSALIHCRSPWFRTATFGLPINRVMSSVE